jgi:division protein CdvB (Snf7/Vps24/ESCRT-III family)
MHKSRLIILTSVIAAILATSVLTSARQEVAGQETSNGLTPEQVAELQTLAKKLSEQSERMNSVISEFNSLVAKGENLSISDMFELQLLMNELEQFSEIMANTITATHQAIESIIRNFKG